MRGQYATDITTSTPTTTGTTDPLTTSTSGTDETATTFIIKPDGPQPMQECDGLMQLDPCNFTNGCDKGLICRNTAAASSACMQNALGCCQPFCDFSKNAPCPNPDQKCLQYFDPMMEIPEGLEDVRVCAIPP